MFFLKILQLTGFPLTNSKWLHVSDPRYCRYSERIEVPKPEEEQQFAEIASRMKNISSLMSDRARHAARSVHAKSHGLLRAELTVLDGLPEPLAQGIFQHGGIYPAIMRFSTVPGDILPDSISTPRGLGIKVIGVEGPMLKDHQGEVTQDLVMVNGKAFPSPDSAAFLEGIKTLEKHVNDSEAFKQIVSTAARTAETVLEAVGTESAALKGFGHPQTNILGETFFTAAPLRYGNYMAKLCLEPASQNLKDLKDKTIDTGSGHSALRDAVVEFFKTGEAVWDLKVQLCVDPETMPIEDASVPWPEELSPYLTVGRLVAPPQDAYSAARRLYVDEILSFNPWHGLEAHRPLGNIMRARKQAYAASSQFRHETNGRQISEPRSIDELPA